jgi:flagellar biosynthesis/type III secretory pathway M-ring protein FliF/YscJ
LCRWLHAAAGAVLVAAVVALMLWLRSYKRRSSQQELLPVKAEQSNSRPASRTGLDGGSKASSDRSGVQKTRKSST